MQKELAGKGIMAGLARDGGPGDGTKGPRSPTLKAQKLSAIGGCRDQRRVASNERGGNLKDNVVPPRDDEGRRDFQALPL